MAAALETEQKVVRIQPRIKRAAATRQGGEVQGGASSGARDRALERRIEVLFTLSRDSSASQFYRSPRRRAAAASAPGVEFGHVGSCGQPRAGRGNATAAAAVVGGVVCGVHVLLLIFCNGQLQNTRPFNCCS